MLVASFLSLPLKQPENKQPGYLPGKQVFN